MFFLSARHEVKCFWWLLCQDQSCLLLLLLLGRRRRRHGSGDGGLFAVVEARKTEVKVTTDRAPPTLFALLATNVAEKLFAFAGVVGS